MARNLLSLSPIETVMPSAASTRRASAARSCAGRAPCSASVPPRSRNASSIDSGSTSGVRRRISARTARPTSRYFAMSGRITTASGTGRQRLEHRHRRAHAIEPRDIAAGEHDAAAAAADDDRPVGELGPVALLDRGVKRVAIEMGDRQVGERRDVQTRRGEPHSPHRRPRIAAGSKGAAIAAQRGHPSFFGAIAGLRPARP